MYTKEELSDLVGKAIQNLKFQEDSGKLFEPVNYILSMGGKRIRPLVTLMACNLFSDKVDGALMPAVGLEVFHNYTLVHDDIMDNAPIRRNKPTVHEKWSLNQAILSGDVMSFVAADFMSQCPVPVLHDVMKIYNRCAIDVCIGQQLDMEYEKRQIISLEEYLEMIKLKTSVLLAACLKIGATIGGAEERDKDLLYQFGLNLGLSFQIMDDLLDVYGDQTVFGKKRGGDIVANKKTFLLLKALEMADGETLRKLKETMNGTSIPEETKVETVVNIYNLLNIREMAENAIKGYQLAALMSLEELSVDHTRKEELFSLAGDLVSRSY